MGFFTFSAIFKMCEGNTRTERNERDRLKMKFIFWPLLLSLARPCVTKIITFSCGSEVVNAVRVCLVLGSNHVTFSCGSELNALTGYADMRMRRRPIWRSVCKQKCRFDTVLSNYWINIEFSGKVFGAAVGRTPRGSRGTALKSHSRHFLRKNG